MTKTCRGRTHIYNTVQLTYKFTLTHGPGSWPLQEKGKRVKKEPAHGPPLQARVAAANRTVLQLANCWFWRTWNERGQSKMKLNGGRR